MTDAGEPTAGTVPQEAQEQVKEKFGKGKIKELPLRDRILAKIEALVTEPDETLRTERINQFIEERTAELTVQSTPTELSLIRGSVYKGFIHPETRVIRSYLVDGVMINDPELYRVLLEVIRQHKEHPEWQKSTMREIAQNALMRTIGTYFGNWYDSGDVEERNRAFYLDHTMAESDDVLIKEFRGKRIGVFAEKAAVTQNLLTFMGYDTELVMSTNNRLGAVDVDHRDGHAYVVVTTDRGHFIFDPTNPAIARKADGSLHTVLPANYPITDEEYHRLESGGQVEVRHYDPVYDGRAYQKGEGVKRIYGGPKNVGISRIT